MKYYTEKTFQRIAAAQGFETVPGPSLVLGFEIDAAKSQFKAYFNGQLVTKKIKPDVKGFTFRIVKSCIFANNGAAGLKEFAEGIYNDPEHFGQSYLNQLIKTTVLGVKHAQEV